MYVEEYQDHAVEIHTFAMNVLLGRCDPPPPNPHWTYFFYNSRKPICIPTHVHMAKCKMQTVAGQQRCLSATCSCLSATQGIYVHTYSHVQMVTNKIMGKNGKLSVFFHISPYSTCICYFIEKTCMYAMKKCILGMYVEEYQDHAVEIHTFAMNVLLGRCDPPPTNPHWTYFSIILGKCLKKLTIFFSIIN